MKVTRRELEPGETFFGGRGVVVPLKQQNDTSPAPSCPPSPDELREQAKHELDSVRADFLEEVARKLEASLAQARRAYFKRARSPGTTSSGVEPSEEAARPSDVVEEAAARLLPQGDDDQRASPRRRRRRRH
jgi:hypothetical protein